MKSPHWMRNCLLATSSLGAAIGALMVFSPAIPRAEADPNGPRWRANRPCGDGCCADDVGGAWYWVRSPEEEKRVVISRFNRYCIRCHGVDGRGVWDIPDVPNFTNARWQACRTDGQLARAILEGRGSVMPPWRGVLSLDEAWVIARYVRTFAAGQEASRPDFNVPAERPAPTPMIPMNPKK
jgi:hypothetical protein